MAAAVDVGTQSVRLLISDGTTVLRRQAVVTHLGRGVRASRTFDPATLAHTLDALGSFRAEMDRLGVARARAVATEVVRLADDPATFLGPAADVLGVPLEPLSGEEEGRLAFAGATAGLDPAGAPFATVDLGGGSCEFAVGRQHCEGVFSAAFGASVLSEAHIASDPPRAEELSTILSILQAHLDEVARTVPALAEAATFIGLGGTFTTMAAVEIGLDPYDSDVVHGFVLTREAAEDVFRTLVTERRADRIHNPGLPGSRLDTIVGGSCAVVAIMRFFGLEAIRISEHDLLDGIAQRLLA